MYKKSRSFKRWAPASVLGVIALALGIFSASAMAEPEPPPFPNGSPPTVSGSLTLGGTITTSNGGWSYNPYKFSYAWLRCNGAGAECAAISGATSSSYKVVSADLGHKLKAAVTATNSGGSTTAYSSLTGYPSATQHWYAEGVKLIEGQVTSYALPASSVQFLFSTHLGKYTFNCIESGSGTLQNPIGGGAGTLEAVIHVNNCSEPSNLTCRISNIEIVTTGSATEFQGQPAVKFNQGPFGILFEFALSNGKANCALPGAFQMQGNFTGISVPPVKKGLPAMLNFTQEASGMSFSGDTGSAFIGTQKWETAGGQGLTVAP